MYAHGVAPWRQTQCGLSARSCGFWLISWGCPVFAEAHDHRGYASSSRLVDMCNWCVCSITTLRRRHVAGSSASKSGEKENCPGTIESRLSAIQCGIWFKAAGDELWPWDGWSRRVAPSRPARARGGESMKRAGGSGFSSQSLRPSPAAVFARNCDS